MPGNGCKPITEANGENRIYMPISMIAAVITIKAARHGFAETEFYPCE